MGFGSDGITVHNSIITVTVDHQGNLMYMPESKRSSIADHYANQLNSVVKSNNLIL